MDVSIGPDQQMVAETAARLADALATTSTEGLPTRDAGDDDWRMLADTGFIGLRLPEEAGGGGATGIDAALVVEQFGRTVSTTPYLGQALLGPELLWRAGADRDVLGAVLAGERRVTIALDGSLGGLARVGPPEAGRTAVAVDARGAHAVLALGADGVLLEVPLAPGDEVLDSADLTRVARVVDLHTAQPIGGPVSPADVMRVEALALAAVSADLVGVMQGALDAAVAYVRERVQFGVPVGSFQAIQHLAADAKVLLEAARSSMWHAAWAVDVLEADEALLAARQAKAYGAQAGRRVGEIQTQLLGGIAITWEELAHVRVRRLLFDRSLFGDESAQEDAIADVLLGASA